MHSRARNFATPLNRQAGSPVPESISGGSADERTARFEIAWRQHFPELYRRGLDWTNGRLEDAEDALGQAAITALQKMPQDLVPSEARGWLLRLVYSKCMDIHRQRRRARYVTREADDPPLEEEVADGEPSFETTLLEEELTAFVKGCVRRLPPRLRSVAELHLLREMRYPEIADALALSEVNVRKRMQHARVLLRERLQAYLAGEPGVQADGPPDEDEAAPPVVEPQIPRSERWSVEALRRYINRHPRGWKKRWELGLRLRQEGVLEEAAFHLREAAVRQPRRLEIWMELGTIWRDLGRYAEAREVFATALCRAHDEVSRIRLRRLMETLPGESSQT
ncbi:MAG TPA: sigma-70 family RNA polymerase sigma factor [Thermoanaerobaculia bacterium]|nr:sigma-70 family RNA polymerase sigma factor [Thermoanaerobaculia bacterium]